ncbi:hypothetical protein PSTT_17072, partial [Puccinia striiformis]
MYYTILLIALLFIHSSQSVPVESIVNAEKVAATGETVLRGKPLNEVKMITPEFRQGIKTKYEKSDKAVFLFDQDGTVQPFQQVNDAIDQKRITAALKKLAADPRNEIWLVTARDVKSLEQNYGHIKNLNFAGYLGAQLSAKNIKEVNLPELGEEFKVLDQEASKVFSGNGIPFKVTKARYYLDYTIPKSGVDKELYMQEGFRTIIEKLKKMVQDDLAYKDYEVNDWDLGDHFRVVLKHKHHSKETIATALSNRDGDKPVDFGLSLGDMVIDEGMHRAMKLKNFDALLVQSDAEVKRLYPDGKSPLPGSWRTFASHRLSDHRDVIQLLEELAKTRRSTPRVDPLGIKALTKSGIERIKVLLGKWKKSLTLLFIPSQSAIRSVTGTTITPFTTGKIVNQGKPLNEVLMVTPEMRKGIQAKYADSDKAVILLGHDGTIKPLRGTNDLEDQKRINAALEKLAADPRNEIWLVSARDVKSLEKTYGHIDNLNFAGYLGGQLSKKNIHDIQLPEVGKEFKELKEDASKIFSESLDELIKMVESNPAYKDYVVDHWEWSLSWEMRGERRVVLKHKYHDTETLSAALLDRDGKKPDFGLSLGSTDIDEGMHRAMRPKNLNALLVKSDDEVERLYSNPQSAPHKVWNTVASHRLCFQAPRRIGRYPTKCSPPRVDPIGMKAPKKNGIERIKIFLGKLKESLGGKNRNYIFKARVKPNPTETLLYIHPSQSVPMTEMADAGKFSPQSLWGKPLNEVNMITPEIRQGIQVKYMDSKKAVFLLDNDGTIKPFYEENDSVDQGKINQALERLAADPLNEVWIITEKDVKDLEKTYGHIKNLNFAGHFGTQLSRRNIHKVQLPDTSKEFREMKQEAAKIFLESGISYRVKEGKYFINYTIPMWEKEWSSWKLWRGRSVLNKEKYDKIVAELNKMVQDKPAYKDYVVGNFLIGKVYRIAITHKYFNKETLPTSLLTDEDREVDFGLSLGDMDSDEGMHRVMQSRGFNALLVKSDEEINRIYSTTTESNLEKGWDTFASHRFSNHKHAIEFLEELVGIAETTRTAGNKTPALDHNGKNGHKNRGIGRIRILLGQLGRTLRLVV